MTGNWTGGHAGSMNRLTLPPTDMFIGHHVLRYVHGDGLPVQE